MTRAHGWAIVDDVTGKLVVIGGHLPIYWLRKVAKSEAINSGFAVDCKAPDVRIRKISVEVDAAIGAVKELR